MPIKLNIQVRSNTASGQTIIEVIIALALIALFLTGVVIVELFAMRNLEFSQNKSTATKLARQQIERARVLRDSGGMSTLGSYCVETDSIPGCYINSDLTPVPFAYITPSGNYVQKIIISNTSSSDCPVPTVVAPPIPIGYVVKANVSWGTGLAITPAPEVEVSSCITDWR